MESEFRRYREPTIPYIAINKQAYRNDLGSPRFFRKKFELIGQNRAFMSRKTQSRNQKDEGLTYISPKKIIQQSRYGGIGNSIGCLGSASTNSLRMPAFFSASMQSLQAHLSKDNALYSQKQMTKNTQQYQSLNAKYQSLQLKYTQLLQDYKKLEQQNASLSQHIDKLQTLISTKDNTIEQLTNQTSFRNQYPQPISPTSFESILQIMHRNQSEHSFHINNENYAKLNSELQQCKSEIRRLEAIIKYSTIQKDMGQKLKHDYKNQVENNNKLKAQNRKLLLKIEMLLRDAENKMEKSRINMREKTERDSEVSLEFSFECDH